MLFAPRRTATARDRADGAEDRNVAGRGYRCRRPSSPLVRGSARGKLRDERGASAMAETRNAAAITESGARLRGLEPRREDRGHAAG